MKKPITYQGISLPKELLKEVHDFIKNKDDYRSIADFVKQAVKDKLSINPVLAQTINNIIDSDDWFTIRKREDGLYERVPKDEAIKDLMNRVRDIKKSSEGRVKPDEKVRDITRKKNEKI